MNSSGGDCSLPVLKVHITGRSANHTVQVGVLNLLWVEEPEFPDAYVR
jgi:hypothetical protein